MPEVFVAVILRSLEGLGGVSAEGGAAEEGEREAGLAGLMQRLHGVWTVTWHAVNPLTTICNKAQQ